MSFLFDKKTEHESLCEAAIQAGRSADAVHHAAKAAEFAFALANQTEGSVSERYIANGETWLDIAERLKTTKLVSTSASPRGSSPNTQYPTPHTQHPIPNTDTPDSDSEFQVTETSDISFDDIAGMEEAKTAIFEMVVYPMREPEKAKALNLKPGGGVLLYGPPGNGKTMLGKAIAHEINAPFFYASGAQIRSKWHGESEQRLSKLITSARNRPVAVLFLDEVDGLLPRRSSGASVVDARIVTQFLADVGGFKDNENTLLILGATNKPWEIDEAVFRTGRFDEKIYIGIPDLPARRGMLERHLKGAPLEKGFDFGKWAEKLGGYTGSDVVGIVHDAKRAALRRSILEGAEPLILDADIAQALVSIPSSVTDKMLAQYKTFREQRFG